MNETGTTSESFSSGRCLVEQQHRRGRQVTAEATRRIWTKDINVVMMQCFYLSKLFCEDGKPKRGYRQQMHRIWQERGLFLTTKQKICDRARAIRKNNWLTDIDQESIRRRVLSEEISNGEHNLERQEETDSNMATNDEMRTEHEEKARVSV